MVYLVGLLAIGGLLFALKFYQELRIEHGVLGVLIVGSVFGHAFFNVSAGGLPITLDRILLGAVWVWLVAWITLGKINLQSINRSDLILLMFIGILTLNVATSNWKYHQNKPVAQLIFNYMLPLALYFVMKNIGHQKSVFRTINFGLMALGTYLAFTAVCEARGWHGMVFPKYILDPLQPEFLGRGRGPFLNPVACGIYQMMALCCGMVWWNRSSLGVRALLASFALLLLAGIFSTLTRSVWLGTIVVLVTYFWFTSGWKWRGIFLAAAPFALICLVVLGGDKINSFKRDKDVTESEMSESIELRPLLAIVAGKMIQERPLFGHGFRQYMETGRSFHIRETGSMPLQKVLPYVQHNLFLAYAVDLGLVGLGVYLLTTGIWSLTSLKIWRNEKLPWEVQQTGYLFLAFLIGFAINGMFHDVSIIPMLHHLLFIFAGWVTGLNTYYFQSKTIAQTGPLPMPSETDRSGLSLA